MRVRCLMRWLFKWRRAPISIWIRRLNRDNWNRRPGGSTGDKEVGRVHVAVIAGDYFLSRRMDFGDNDRLDNKKSFAAFALRLTLEALDRVDENEAVVEKVLSKDEGDISFDTSQLDPLSEEWEGSLEWQKSPRTVAEDIGKVDLASLTDWDDKE